MYWSGRCQNSKWNRGNVQTEFSDVSKYAALIVKDIETIGQAVDMLIAAVDREIRWLQQAPAGNSGHEYLLRCMGALDTICSNVDILLMRLDRLEEAIMRLLVGYPETVHQLLRSLALVDNNVVRCKSNALQMKLALLEMN
jgi:hypothetical protein